MKKLFLSILVLGLVLSGNAAYSLTQESAINQYLSNKKLEPLEGVWINNSNGGIYVAYKNSGSNYTLKIISHKYFPNGETVGILTKGSETVFYGQQLLWSTGWGVQFDWCNSAVYNITSVNRFTSRCDQVSSNYSRVWPSNLQSHNSKFDKKKIADKEKSPKITPDNNKVVPAGSGSGFFVSSDGHIITNHHVINGCNTTKVSFKGNQIEAQILAVDKMNDIAILKTNIKPDSFFAISNEDVSLLEDVVVAGYPLGKQVSSAIKTHKGVVTALAGAGDNYSNFQTDASINAGNSGGPIMNQKGNIVGIAVATWVQDGVQGVHFGIKSSTLKTFANSNSLKFSSPNYLELSNKDLGKLITDATVYLECHMTVANIKKMMAEANNQKAFFSEFK
jgi:S1-C subfamily serine protease